MSQGCHAMRMEMDGARGARRRGAVGAAGGVGDTRRWPRREGSRAEGSKGSAERAHGAQRAQEGAEGRAAGRVRRAETMHRHSTRPHAHASTGALARTGGTGPPLRPPRGGRPGWPLAVVPTTSLPRLCVIPAIRAAKPASQASFFSSVLLIRATAVQLPDLARRLPRTLRGAPKLRVKVVAPFAVIRDPRCTPCTHARRG